MNGVYTARQLPCYPKRGYAGREGAAQNLAKMELRDPTAIGRLNIYFCIHCGGYHIGNRREDSTQEQGQ